MLLFHYYSFLGKNRFNYSFLFSLSQKERKKNRLYLYHSILYFKNYNCFSYI